MFDVTINEIKNMVLQSLREISSNNGMLNEISKDDAYAKFYSRIPKETYDNIMSDTNKMTPIHQALLGVILRVLSNGGDIESVNRYVEAVKGYVKRMDQQQRQYCVSQIKTEMLAPKNFSYLTFNNIIMDSLKQKFVTYKQNSQNGLVKLFENSRILITCTTTYTASHHYYGHTHWCTASGIDGAIGGYNSFRGYVNNTTGHYCLIQFVLKGLENKIYQVLYNSRCEAIDMKDFNDESGIEDFGKLLRYVNHFAPNAYEEYVIPKIPEMVKKTADDYVTEEDALRDEFIKKSENILNKLPNIPTFEEMQKLLVGVIDIYDIKHILTENFQCMISGNRKYSLINIKQNPEKIEEYIFVTRTKNITNLDFKDETFCYSWAEHKLVPIPDGFDNVLMVFGNTLFSCATNDIKTYDFVTKETNNYNWTYLGTTTISGREFVRFASVDNMHFVDKLTGKIVK